MTYPLGSSKETRFATTSAGKRDLHTVGCVAVGSFDFREVLGYFYGTHGMEAGSGIHAPPHRYLEELCFPVRVEVRGISLRMRVRRTKRSSAIQRKSSRESWMPLVRVTLLPLTWRRDYCI